MAAVVEVITEENIRAYVRGDLDPEWRTAVAKAIGSDRRAFAVWGKERKRRTLKHEQRMSDETDRTTNRRSNNAET